MRQDVDKPRSKAAAIAFDLLDPIPYGFFVGALVFDTIYARSAEILWVKAAGSVALTSFDINDTPYVVKLLSSNTTHSGQFLWFLLNATESKTVLPLKVSKVRIEYRNCR